MDVHDLGGTSGDRIYLEERLARAIDSLEDVDLPMKHRLNSAYVYGLSGLKPENFPDPEGRAEFEGIVAALTKYGQAAEGEGDLPTMLWTMSDEDAVKLAEHIVQLAARYGQA